MQTALSAPAVEVEVEERVLNLSSVYINQNIKAELKIE
jgi:hypothetical protein